jgi:DNA-binding IscR family transcriptional regulator
LLETEGGSLGRREIIEALGLSDDRYNTVANTLVDDEFVSKNRGRTGGLRLEATKKPSVSRSVARQRLPEDPPLERDL